MTITTMQPLPYSFYEPTADIVAPQLLGHYLFRRTEDGLCGGIIVETEAYLADDPACHAYRRQTARNQAMWGAPGHAYVYLIYGAYFCFNAVCRPAGVAEAVLVRAVHPTHGLEWMQQQRPVLKERDLTNGPGKLCRALNIDRQFDAIDICQAESPLFIAENPQQKYFVAQQGPLITTTRIGITQAADWPLRYYLDADTFVSRRAKVL
jgi:DNA-3-methyladenine glycosylase